MHPSLVWAICAAVDIFFEVRRLGLMLKPGMEANTSRIVDACVTEEVDAGTLESEAATLSDAFWARGCFFLAVAIVVLGVFRRAGANGALFACDLVASTVALALSDGWGGGRLGKVAGG